MWLRASWAGAAFLVAAAFLSASIAVALFGFGVISDEAPLSAKLFSAFFLLAAAAAFGWVWVNRSRQVA